MKAATQRLESCGKSTGNKLQTCKQLVSRSRELVLLTSGFSVNDAKPDQLTCSTFSLKHPLRLDSSLWGVSSLVSSVCGQTPAGGSHLLCRQSFGRFLRTISFWTLFFRPEAVFPESSVKCGRCCQTQVWSTKESFIHLRLFASTSGSFRELPNVF